MATRYRIVGELGRGGMGVVYRALHVDLDREVALKAIASAPEECSPDDLARFHREVRVLSELAHPNVVHVLDSGEMDGRPFYTMAIVEGEDLAALSKGEPQPFARVVEILLQASDALAYLHAQGVSHRDIKPSNIMVRLEDVHVTLMDFGLARVPTATVRTASGVLVGTPRFLAPESILGGAPEPRSDVFALALTAHEVLTGATWHRAGSLVEMARHILKGPAPSVARARPDVPAWFLKVQEAALAKDPRERLSAAEYRDGLAAGAPPPPKKRTRKDSASAPGAAPKSRTADAPALSRVTGRVPAMPPRTHEDALRRIDLAPWWERRGPALATALALAAGVAVLAVLVVRPARRPRAAASPSAPASASVTPAVVESAAPATPLSFLCWPADRAIVVVAELRTPGAFTLELKRHGRAAPAAVQSFGPQVSWCAHPFRDLERDTEYDVSLEPAGGGGGIRAFPVTTAGIPHRDNIEAALTAADAGELGLNTACEVFFQSPDVRGAAKLASLFAAGKLDEGQVHKATWLGRRLRDRPLTELALARASKPGAKGYDMQFALDAAVPMHLPAARALAMRELPATTHGGVLSYASLVLSREHDPAATDLIERAYARTDWNVEVVQALALADPERARAAFTRDLVPGAAESPRAYAAAAGFLARCDAADVPHLAAVARAGGPAIARVLDALCAIASPAARNAVLEAFRARPTARETIRAVARLKLAAADRELARVLAAPAGEPGARRDAACALGLVGASEGRRELLAALAGAPAPVADAAAWALGQLYERGAADALLARALGDDPRGVAAWALGRVGRPGDAAPLAALAGRLASDAGARGRLLCLTWTLGRLGGPEARAQLSALAASAAHPSLKEEARLALDPSPAPAGETLLVMHPLPFLEFTGTALAAGEAVRFQVGGAWSERPGAALRPAHVAHTVSGGAASLALVAGSNLAPATAAPAAVWADRAGELVVRPYANEGAPGLAVEDTVAGLIRLRIRR